MNRLEMSTAIKVEIDVYRIDFQLYQNDFKKRKVFVGKQLADP